MMADRISRRLFLRHARVLPFAAINVQIFEIRPFHVPEFGLRHAIGGKQRAQRGGILIQSSVFRRRRRVVGHRGHGVEIWRSAADSLQKLLHIRHIEPRHPADDCFGVRRGLFDDVGKPAHAGGEHLRWHTQIGFPKIGKNLLSSLKIGLNLLPKFLVFIGLSLRQRPDHRHHVERAGRKEAQSL